jgi:hypothetical protein
MHGRIAAIGIATLVSGFIAFGQGGGDIKEGKVYISGENPVIRLLLKEGAQPSTNVSFWRVVHSPVGKGHACYVTSGQPGGQVLRAAFTDNDRLLDYLNKEIMSAFDKSYAEKPFPSIKATFESRGDTLTEWMETVTSEKYKVQLVWKDFYEPFVLDTPTGGERIPYGIVSLFVPARNAEVIINGTKAEGKPFPQPRGKMQSSTAFLAFSETWVK